MRSVFERTIVKKANSTSNEATASPTDWRAAALARIHAIV
jgi:hypothetical protein